MSEIKFEQGTPKEVDGLYVVRRFVKETGGTDIVTSLMMWTGKAWNNVAKTIPHGPNVFFAGPVESHRDTKSRLGDGT